ncbi:MAG: hypothetical protein AAB833_01945 [Patescibacteria group bacterium]
MNLLRIITKETAVNKSFLTIIIAGCLLGSGAIAASIYSTNAELWFTNYCREGAKGIIAGVCDLRERVIGLESVPVPETSKTLVVRDADGGYVGKLFGIEYDTSLGLFGMQRMTILTSEGYLLSIWDAGSASKYDTGDQVLPAYPAQPDWSDKWEVHYSEDNCIGTATIYGMQNSVPEIIPIFDIPTLSNKYYVTKEVLHSSFRSVWHQELFDAYEYPSLKPFCTNYGYTSTADENLLEEFIPTFKFSKFTSTFE